MNPIRDIQPISTRRPKFVTPLRIGTIAVATLVLSAYPAFVYAQSTTTDTGAPEFLANLSIGTIVLAAFVLTTFRLAILAMGGAFKGVSSDGTGSGISDKAAIYATPAPGPGEAWARGIAEILESLIIAAVLVFLIIRPFFVQAFFIPSESMEYTLLGHDAGTSETGATHTDTVHDHIFVNKLIYRFQKPQRGDIIVFKAPKSADAEHSSDRQVENVLIKRLIGIPGDRIEIKQGHVWLNGKMQEEFHRDPQDPQHNLLPGYSYSIREPMDPSEAAESRFLFGAPSSPGNGVVPPGPVTLGPHQFWVMGDNRNNSNDSRYWGPLDDNRVIGKASVIFWPLNRIRLLH